MIRTAETLRKQLKIAEASQPTPLSDKDRILAILDKEMQKAVIQAAERRAITTSVVNIEFWRYSFLFPEKNISCQLAAEVKRALQDAGYNDVSIFREMDPNLGEKRCVRIEVGIG